MILTQSLYYLVSVLSLVAAQPSSPTCTATVTFNSTMPGHAAFIYHDIYVENTGSCPITKVFASITLPPMEEAFDYQNVSSATGELSGLSEPLLPSSIELGGTVVLRSARLPLISLGSVECSASCMGTSDSTQATTPTSTSTAPVRAAQTRPRVVRSSPSITTKVEIEWGANPRWVALSLIDDVDTSDVWIIDAKNSRQLMKRENWDTKNAYTVSPNLGPLELPLSLELISKDGEVITLKNFITSFSYAVLDTQASFSHTPVAPADYSLHLSVHPSSNSHWVALTPYGTEANQVTSISIKASNTDYAPMTLEDVGFFTLSSPDLALRLPLSAQITFADGHVMDVEDVLAL